MTDTNPKNECYEKIVREHQRLRDMLEELKQILSERTGEFSVVATRISELRELVARHFQTEEDSGCFGDIVNHAPHVAGKVDALIAEHSELATLIGDLASKVSLCQGSQSDWEEIATKFEEFNAKHSRHELVEMELMQGVFTEDIGSKD